MASTKSFSAKGTVFSFGPASGSPVVYTTVAEIKTIQFSGGKLDLEDVTNMDSPGAFREQVPTLLSGGDLSLSGNYVSGDAGRAAFNTAYLARTLVSCKVVLPLAPAQTTTGDSFTFEGYISENNVDLQFDKVSSFSAKVTITGPLTEVAGS